MSGEKMQLEDCIVPRLVSDRLAATVPTSVSSMSQLYTNVGLSAQGWTTYASASLSTSPKKTSRRYREYASKLRKHSGSTKISSVRSTLRFRP